MSAIYHLLIRHGQFSGFQDLIFDLKALRFSESSMLLGRSSHIFGSIKDIVSESRNKQALYFLFQMPLFF